MESIYRWCRAGESGIPGSCIWRDTVESLLQRFPESEEVSPGNWEIVEASLVVSEEVVIVTISDPLGPVLHADHAVVLLQVDSDEQGRILITYCDPATGELDTISLSRFLRFWDAPGGRGFILRP